MILSDKSIKAKIKSGEIKIEPYDEKFLQPATYDLHLGSTFLVYDEADQRPIDTKKPVENRMKKVELKDGDQYTIMPGEFILGHLIEITGVDNKHVGRLEGKSSIARLGLIIHTTAGFLDPGNDLRLTLEMVNLSPLPIIIYVGMKIAQIAFEELDQAVENTYGSPKLHSKYFKDMSVSASNMYKNFTDEKK
ncbi:dCTP deaminase [Candidatus Dojkabacteria bacterium]|jgi:dCTP deaminase|nr:dCTP deaminase [Candidatus Dojkabacteria bacterium]